LIEVIERESEKKSMKPEIFLETGLIFSNIII
jgi:hypothetical protein